MTTITVEMSPEVSQRMDALEAKIDKLLAMQSDENELLTTVEAARIRNCSVDTIRKMVKEGRLECLRPGGRKMFFRRADLIK